jgi:6-pyruvoyltetrahydropterin/6-carboxytetrahydropterin synthase
MSAAGSKRPPAAADRAAPPAARRFTVRVAKDFLKFSAAHFMAYKGFREALHGHNYQVAVTVEGDLGSDGYVLDFGLVKRAAKRVCDELDEKMIVPVRSDCLTVVERGDAVELTYEDGARFVFPRADVCLLPIAHSSAEELSRYVLGRLRDELRPHAPRGLTTLEVAVAEAPGQAASYREAM